MKTLAAILVAVLLAALPSHGQDFLSFQPTAKPVVANFDFDCTPTLAKPAPAVPIVPVVEPYRIRYRTHWYVNGSLDPECQRMHLMTEHGLDPTAVNNLSASEVLATHAAAHEGTLDVARFNAWFSQRSVLVSTQADCPDGQCPIDLAPVAAPVAVTQSCPSGSCPTATHQRSTVVVRSGPARPVARVATVPVRFFRNRQPIRTFFRNGGFFRRGRCR